MTEELLEGEVQSDVKKILLAAGFTMSDMSQGYRGGSRRNRSTRQTKGIPDLYLQHVRLQIRGWIEVKGTKTLVTKDQRVWHAHERAAGGFVWIIRSPDELVERLRVECGMEITLRPRILTGSV